MSKAPEPDFYELLGVSRQADGQQIRAAYKRLARQLHPDAGGSAGMFRLVRQAFETLSDAGTRADYDGGQRSTSRQGQPEPGPDSADGGEDLVPEMLSWWADVDPEAPVHVSPAFRSGRAVAIASAAGWGCLTGLLAVLWWSQTWPGWVLAFVVVALFSAAAAARFGWSALPAPTGWTTMLTVVVGFFAAYGSADGELLLAIGGGLWLVGFGVVPWLVSRWLRVRELDAALPAGDLERLRLFGRPAGATPDHEIASRLGAEQLSLLCRIPAVRIAHTLCDPETDQLLADHAVICGDQVAVVACRAWPPGSYTLDTYGQLLRNGGPYPTTDLDLGAALTRLRQLLPGLAVFGLLMVHPTEGVVSVDVEAVEEWTTGCAPEVLDAIGAWLAQQPATVQRRPLLRLLELVRL